MRNAFIDIMAHAKFYFNRLMLTLIFGIWASEPPPGPGERLKRPGLIGLKLMRYWKFSQKTELKQNFFANSEKEVGNFFKTGTIVYTAQNNIFGGRLLSLMLFFSQTRKVRNRKFFNSFYDILPITVISDI